MSNVSKVNIEDSTESVVPNVLPCAVHHCGTTQLRASHWRPVDGGGQDDPKLAYFRGRKLLGTRLKLSANYRGVILEQSQPKPDDNTAAGDQPGPGTEELRAIGKFEEMVIWGHESCVNQADDVYTRTMNEWIQAAEHIHEIKG